MYNKLLMYFLSANLKTQIYTVGKSLKISVVVTIK